MSTLWGRQIQYNDLETQPATISPAKTQPVCNKIRVVPPGEGHAGKQISVTSRPWAGNGDNPGLIHYTHSGEEIGNRSLSNHKGQEQVCLKDRE